MDNTLMKILFAAGLAVSMIVVMHAAHTQTLYGSGDDPLVAEVLGTEIHTRDADEMSYVILSKLVDRYAAEQGIGVEPAEIDAYVESVHRSMQQDRRQQQARRDELMHKLSSADLPAAGRPSLEKELAALNELLDTTSDTAEDQAARREIAAAFIRQWKINRALYRQYGGRIIYQQGGPEPLDAYRRFLEQQADAGAFKIMDKAFETVFWRYYITDSLHSFYPPGSAEEARAFETPGWLTDK
jgi:hypothetical protein